MENLPAIDLIEAHHTFPGPYTFKVIGKSEGGFTARVVAAVRDELEAEVDPPFRIRHTAGGRHVSVTVEPVMETAWDVLAVYSRLRETDGLVMMF